MWKHVHLYLHWQSHSRKQPKYIIFDNKLICNTNNVWSSLDTKLNIIQVFLHILSFSGYASICTDLLVSKHCAIVSCVFALRFFPSVSEILLQRNNKCCSKVIYCTESCGMITMSLIHMYVGNETFKSEKPIMLQYE